MWVVRENEEVGGTGVRRHKGQSPEGGFRARNNSGLGRGPPIVLESLVPRAATQAASEQSRSYGMNLRLLVIHSVGVLLLDLVLLRRRHREVFLPLTNGRVPHKILEARRGEDAHQADDVVADVEDSNPRAGRA